MTTHDLKVWPQYYKRLADGTKTFEIRNNDRGYQSGDKLILREWDPSRINPTDDMPVGYTGSPALEFKVGFIHPTGREDVVLSLLPMVVKKCDCQNIKAAESTKTGESKTKKGKSTATEY